MQKAFEDYTMRNCVFCRDNRFKNNFKVGFSLEESLIYEDAQIFITPDLAPLLRGHYLVVSQDHYHSFAEAPAEVHDSLRRAIDYLADKLNCSISWFEHGAVFPGKGGASIDHAHLHILACDLDIQKAVEADGKYLECVPYSDETFCSLARRQPYLLIGGSSNDTKLYYVDLLPSQYLRDIVMQLREHSDYNWKHVFTSEESKNKYRETLNLL